MLKQKGPLALIILDGFGHSPAREGNAVALARHLQQLIQDSSTRARLIATGRARAQQFTWSASAAAHLAVYQSVAG